MALSRELIAMALWMAFAVAVPTTAALADDARGEALFELCSQCHGSAGQGNQAALAPSIAGLDSWYVVAQLDKFRSGVRGTHPDDTGGLRMYPMSRWLSSDEDVAAVSAYVAELPSARPAPVLEGGNAARGAQVYTPCVACHDMNGLGKQAMGAPPLVRSSDWYLLASLQKYKSGARGSNPADAPAAMMRAMAGTLADEQAMLDVIAHITTLSE